MTAEQEITIEKNPYQVKSWALGIIMEVTRVARNGKGVDISTAQHPEGWFETVAFPLTREGTAMEPLISNTRPFAARVHEFAVQVATEALKI